MIDLREPQILERKTPKRLERFVYIQLALLHAGQKRPYMLRIHAWFPLLVLLARYRKPHADGDARNAALAYCLHVPLFIGPLIGIALGAGLALLAQSNLPPELDKRRARTVLTLLSAFVFLPVCAYFASFWGDWAIFYLIDARSVPIALPLFVLILDALSITAGWSLARDLQSRRPEYGAAVLILPLLTSALLITVFFSRLRLDGSFRQVHGNFGTQSLLESPLCIALLWMLGLLAAGFLQSASWLRGAPPAVRPKAPPPSPSHLKASPTRNPR